MYFNIRNKDGELAGADPFGTVKFKAKKVIVDGVVEVYPYRDKLLIKTPHGHYLEKELFLCVWRIDRRPGTHVEIGTYVCKATTLHIPGD